MGLDWNPMGKPQAGKEAEFKSLFEALTAPPPKPTFWQNLLGTTPKEDRSALKQRFRDLMILPYETLQAPRVGFSAAADAWLKDKYELMPEPRPAWDEHREKMKGYYVLDLVPACEGLPQFSNAALGYAELFSFRAQFLRDCEDILGEELLERCYQHCLAEDLASLGQAIENKALAWAAGKKIDLPSDDAELEPESDEEKLAVMIAAAKWARFWSSQGHGLEPDY
ncbi:MAG: hypothetical protein RL095_2331 [Verrucomicrobiota bacterium]|jgi:hypothetical protein